MLSAPFCYFSASRLALTAQDGRRQGSACLRAATSTEWAPPAGWTPRSTGRHVSARARSRSSARVLQPPPLWHPEAAVGQTVRINDKPFSVIGVAPPPFFGAEPGRFRTSISPAG